MPANTQRNALLLLCAVIAALLIAHLFRGDKTETWSVPVTNALVIATPCASSVAINPDSTLRNRIEIIAKARDKAQITELQTTGGATAYISGAGSHCRGQSACTETTAVCAGLPDDPTLSLAIAVPADIAITVTETQGADYQIGNVGGPLTLNLAGSGDVSAAAATGLNATLTGSGDVHVESVTGTINATLSKSGDLDIANAAAPATNLTLDGDGDVNSPGGNLGTLNATLSHDGDLHIAAAQNTSLLLSADGDVDIGKILGNLTATLTGDGDLSVGTVAGNADLTSSGNGDITIPHVAGHLMQANTGDGDFKINGS
jgi:hypothetical protein